MTDRVVIRPPFIPTFLCAKHGATNHFVEFGGIRRCGDCRPGDVAHAMAINDGRQRDAYRV